MMKCVALLCATALIVTTGAFGLNLIGWFGSSPAQAAETQVQPSDQGPSDAAIRFRHNQNLNWRCVMMFRE